MATKQPYNEYRVLDVPTSGLTPGDRYYLYVGGGKYKTLIVSDGAQITQEAGQEFIECDTVDDLRILDARQIWAIQNGYYKGVTLSGYYSKGDTPAPIQYYLSDTAESDDGGSVFEVGGIKLEHEFVGNVNLAYFGIKNGEDIQEQLLLALSLKLPIIVPNGDYLFKQYLFNNYDLIDIDFQDSNITYLNDSSLGLAYLIRIENSSNINIKHASFSGPMFTDIDINNIPTEIPYTNKIYINSRAIDIRNSSNINIKDVRALYWRTTLHIDNSSNININDLFIDYTCDGIELFNVNNVAGSNITVNNAKYNLYATTYGTDPTEHMIGAQGVSIRLRTVVNGNFSNIICRYGASDSIRYDGTCENVTVRDSETWYARRNSFSAYSYEGNGGKNLKYINCTAYYSGDPNVWTGKDTVDTYNRPHELGATCDFLAAQENNDVQFIDCKSINYNYTDISQVPVPDMTQFFNNIGVGSFVRSTVTSKIKLIRYSAIGYSRNNMVSLESDDNQIIDSYFEYPNINDLEVNIFNISSNNNYIRDNITLFGYQSIMQNTYSGNKILNNTLYNPFTRGVNLRGSNHLLKGNSVVYDDRRAPSSSNHRSFYIDGGKSIITNNEVIDQSSNPITISSYFSDTALAIGNVYKNNTAPSYGNFFVRSNSAQFANDNNTFFKEVNGTNWLSTNSDITLRGDFNTININNSSQVINVTLPGGTDVADGKIFTINNINGTQPVNVLGSISGANNIVLQPNQSITVQRIGTQYRLVSTTASASANRKGLVNQAAAVPDGSSIDTLLASLRTAGLIAT